MDPVDHSAGTAAVAPAEPAGSTAAPEGAADKLYTQADLDQLVEDRVAAARTAVAPAPEGESIPAVEPAAEPLTKLFTQEELDKHGKVAENRVRRQFADYADLKKRAEALEGSAAENTTLKDELTAAQAERDAAKTEALRLEVALEHKLPMELAKRLQGLTREDIEADATSLVAVAGTAAGGFGGGVSGVPVVKGESFDDLVRKAAGF